MRCAKRSAALSTPLGWGRFSWSRGRPTTRALLTGVLSGAVLLAIGRARGSPLLPPALDPYQGSLLKEPVGYANALGILMALAVVLGLGLFIDARRRLAAGCAGRCHVRVGGRTRTDVQSGRLACGPRGPRRPRGVPLRWIRVEILSDRRRGRRRSCCSRFRASPSETGRPTGALRSRTRRRARCSAPAPAASTTTGSSIGRFPRTSATRTASTSSPPRSWESSGWHSCSAPSARRWRRLRARAIARLVAPAAAAYSAFLVHAGLDWDWEMPVTTLAGLACGAALLASGRGLSRS